MKRCYVLIFVFSFSCKTLSPQTKTLLSEKVHPKKFLVGGINNLKSNDGDCGPAALAMVLTWAGKKISMDEIKPKVITPDKEGSLPTDIIATARSLGMLTFKVKDLTSIVRSVKAGNPVIAFFNMGFPNLPIWHYVVVVGYDLERQQFNLFSGNEEIGRAHV